MEGEITRKTVLIDCLKIMRKQLAICSKNYNGLEPKDNMEEIWSELRVKVKILEDIIHAFESEPVRKAIANWQIEVMEHGPSALKVDDKPDDPASREFPTIVDRLEIRM